MRLLHAMQVSKAVWFASWLPDEGGVDGKTWDSSVNSPKVGSLDQAVLFWWREQVD